MEQSPLWVQFIIGVVVIGCIPTCLIVFIGSASFFPKSLRPLLMIAGLITIKGLYRIIPLSENAKDYSGITFFGISVIFLIWAIKNKWLWNKET